MARTARPADTLRGTAGLDVFKITGHSIAGWVPSHKTGEPRIVRQPFTSQEEERLALYLEYHPHVQTFQRGDASPAFAQAHKIATPLGSARLIPSPTSTMACRIPTCPTMSARW